GERRKAPIGADRPRAIARQIRGAGQRLQGGEVIRTHSEQLVESLHRHLRRLIASGSSRRFRGVEGGGLLPCLSGQSAQGQEALRGAGIFAAPFADDRLRPQRGRAFVALLSQRRCDVQCQLVRLRISDQQAQQSLGGERVRLVHVAAPEVQLSSGAQVALRNHLLRVGEGAGAFQGKQQVLVRNAGRGNSAGGEAQSKPA